MSTTPTPQTKPLQTQTSPFDGLKDIKLAKDIPVDGYFKIAIMGKPKSGKSRFAVTIPGSKMVYDFDDRAVSIAGTPNTAIRTLKDTLQNPTAVDTIEADLSDFKYKKLKGLPIPENYIFDTISNYIENGIKHSYLRENPKDGRKLTIGRGVSVQVGISFDRINTTMRYLDYILTEFSTLGNVIFVFHERDEKDKAESKPNDTKYTGLVTLEPQFASNILTFFNEVFRVEVSCSPVANSQPKYQVYCKPTSEVIAATTLLVDAVEAPDLTQMIAKSKQRKAELAKTN